MDRLFRFFVPPKLLMPCYKGNPSMIFPIIILQGLLYLFLSSFFTGLSDCFKYHIESENDSNENVLFTALI